jgi:hypothetical protein
MISPYAKAVLFVIRLAACGLIVLSLGLYASDLYLYLSHRPCSGPALLALKAAPALAGVGLGWKAKAMAVHLTKDLD